MACRYIEKCPNATGWCNGPKQDFSRCVEFLVAAYENEKAKSKKILYLCDRRACDKCNSACEHTSDIEHAVNFQILQDSNETVFVEVPNAEENRK